MNHELLPSPSVEHSNPKMASFHSIIADGVNRRLAIEQRLEFRRNCTRDLTDFTDTYTPAEPGGSLSDTPPVHARPHNARPAAPGYTLAEEQWHHDRSLASRSSISPAQLRALDDTAQAQHWLGGHTQLERDLLDERCSSSAVARTLEMLAELVEALVRSVR
jgi:hypothetical protein